MSASNGRYRHQERRFPELPAWASVILQWTWGQPQTLLGLLVLLAVRIVDPASSTVRYRGGTVLTRTTILGGGLSLGLFLFSFDYRRSPGRAGAGAQERIDAHEWGHSLQSCMLGPAYLPAVGLPSVFHAARFRMRAGRDPAAYYRVYPERWADRLAGVRRAANDSTKNGDSA